MTIEPTAAARWRAPAISTTSPPMSTFPLAGSCARTSPVATPIRTAGDPSTAEAATASSEARIARSASSSCARGTPKIATTAPGSARSTAPPWAAKTARSRSYPVETSRWSRSGSGRPSSFGTISSRTTVTSLRTSSSVGDGSPGGGVGSSIAAAGGRRRPVERRFLPQDRAFEIAKTGGRIDPEFVGEDPASVPDDVQGIRLTPRSIERQHQLLAEPLSQRVPGDERLQLGRDLRVPADGELGLVPSLDPGEPQLVESGDVGDRRTHQRQIAERVAAPHRRRVAQDRGRRPRPRLCRGPPFPPRGPVRRRRGRG